MGRREQEKLRRQYQRELEREQAMNQVDAYERYMQQLQTLHTAKVDPIDWHERANAPEPRKPDAIFPRKEDAQKKLDNFKPNFLLRMLKLENWQRKRLLKRLERAKELDKHDNELRLRDYTVELEQWQLARRVVAGEIAAYGKVIEERSTFSKIELLGESVSFSLSDPKFVCAKLNVHSEDLIPKESRTLLKSGKLSLREIPQKKLNKYYQDYVCSATLRVAIEVFAMLPIDTVYVTAEDEILNPSTGHIELQPILSAQIPRDTIKRLNLSKIDPSDCFKNFNHAMDFSDFKGFQQIKPLMPNENHDSNSHKAG